MSRCWQTFVPPTVFWTVHEGRSRAPGSIHNRYDRCITMRELARLHGFPDWFRLYSTKWLGPRQFGNAVPPPLARVIAAEVANSLDIAPARSRGTIELSDPGLLLLDISGAAAYFEVDPLPSRRDRKGGAKTTLDEMYSLIHSNVGACSTAATNPSDCLNQGRRSAKKHIEPIVTLRLFAQKLHFRVQSK